MALGELDGEALGADIGSIDGEALGVDDSSIDGDALGADDSSLNGEVLFDVIAHLMEIHYGAEDGLI